MADPPSFRKPCGRPPSPHGLGYKPERNTRIFQMRRSGVPVAEIAVRYGITSQTVSKIVNRMERATPVDQVALDALARRYRRWL